MKKSMLREVGISLFIAIFIIIGLEGVSRIIYMPKRLDKILSVLEEDQSRLWKVRSNLNQDFFGEIISTDDMGFRISASANSWDKSKIRLAVMGASPSFGWGVDNQSTYSSKIAEYSMNQVSVKNFSQIGYSSFQGTKLVSEVLKSRPTHVLITYVINDLDYYRFFYSQNKSDKEVQTKSKLLIALRNYTKQLYLPKIIINLLRTKNTEKVSLDRVTRVSEKDYLLNIGKIVSQVTKKGITPVLAKFPVNMPIQENIGEDIKKIQNSKIRIRAKKYNKLLEKYSKENNVKLIDLTKIVTEKKEYLFLDPNGDTIHPNKIGHKYFAKEILKNIL